MSHATVVVLAYSKEQANLLLAPYDENLVVDEREVPCQCVGTEARTLAEKHVDAVRGMDWEGEREAFNKKHPENLEEGTPEVRAACQKLWEDEVYSVRNKIVADYIAVSELKDKVDPDCSDCNGTGKATTKYNPLSKHDYFQPIEDALGRYGKDFQLAMNPEECDDEKNISMTFAIVTPFHGWQEKARLGWWGMTSDDKEQHVWEGIYWEDFNEALRLGMKPFVYDYHI